MKRNNKVSLAGCRLIFILQKIFRDKTENRLYNEMTDRRLTVKEGSR